MPTPPCVIGTYIDKMNEALRFSEKARHRVAELTKEIGDLARAELIDQYKLKRVSPPSPGMIATAIEMAIGHDSRWSNAVNDEQWGYRLATMYAQAELVLANRENTQVLKAIHEQQQTQIVDQRRLLAEQRTTNELLKMLVGQLSVPVQRPDPPVPPQRAGGAPVNTIDPDNPHPAGW